MNAEVKLTARMLRAAAFLPWLSAALTILAAASLLFRCGGVAAMIAILLGVAACFYGFRIALDASLFDDILSGTLTTSELDLFVGREDRPWSDRCRGARMLIVKGATLTLLQLVVLALVRSCVH
jgi:hypothetical protein